MAASANGDPDPFEEEVLDCAYHSMLLGEFRNGSSALPALPVDEYRQRMADALLAVMGRGLVTAHLTSWPDEYDARQPLSIAGLQPRLDDGTAWDPDVDPLIALDLTAEGKTLFGPPR